MKRQAMQTKTNEFKKVAKLSCTCGCGTILTIEADIKSENWLVVKIETGWKNKSKSHIGYELLAEESDGTNLKNFATKLLEYLDGRDKRINKK